MTPTREQLMAGGAALVVLLSLLLGRCTAPSCPEPEDCPPCPDCELEALGQDLDADICPIVERRWGTPERNDP